MVRAAALAGPRVQFPARLRGLLFCRCLDPLGVFLDVGVLPGRFGRLFQVFGMLASVAAQEDGVGPFFPFELRCKDFIALAMGPAKVVQEVAWVAAEVPMTVMPALPIFR